MKISYKDLRLRVFAIFSVHILCHHGKGGGVLQMMMVDDLGRGDGGPKKAIL